MAAYVARDPRRLVGFGSVDPNDPKAPDELERMKHHLGLRGCKLGPIYQDADPLGPSFLRVCETLERPMLVHQGTTFVRRGPLLHARPALGIDKPLEAAAHAAVRHLMDWLVEDFGYSRREAYLTVGLNPDFRLRVHQMTAIRDLSFVVGAVLPRAYLTQPG